MPSESPVVATSPIDPDTATGEGQTATAAQDVRRRQARDDLVLGAVLAAITIVYGVQTFALPEDSPNQADIGPRAYPLLILLLLALSTLLLIAHAVVRRRASRGDRSAPPAGNDAPRSPRDHLPLGRLVAVVVVTLAYLQALELLGFLVSTAIYLVVETVLIGGLARYRGRRAWVPVVFGCLAALAIYLLFGRSLGVLLPHGPFIF